MGVGPGRWRVRTHSVPREQRRGRYLEGQERVVLSVGNETRNSLGGAGENDPQERGKVAAREPRLEWAEGCLAGCLE